MEQNEKQFDVAVAKLRSNIYGQDGLISSQGETKNQLPWIETVCHLIELGYFQCAHECLARRIDFVHFVWIHFTLCAIQWRDSHK